MKIYKKDFVLENYQNLLLLRFLTSPETSKIMEDFLTAILKVAKSKFFIYL